MNQFSKIAIAVAVTLLPAIAFAQAAGADPDAGLLVTQVETIYKAAAGVIAGVVVFFIGKRFVKRIG